MGISDFQWLVESHYTDLYRFALSLARNPDEAGDLTQQAFAIYAEKEAQIRDRSRCKNWLFTTLYREFLKFRSRGRRMVSLEESTEVGEVPAEAGRSAEQSEMLQALASLEESQRAILTLFYLEQHSYRDIAEILGIPTGTVMSRLSRAKQALRTRLETGPAERDAKIIPLPEPSPRRIQNG